MTSGALAFGKGLTTPNRWSATQAQVNYHFGFVKRGLFGQLFAGPLGLQHYRRFVAFSGFILILLVLSLVLYTAKSRLQERFGSYQFAALFFSSYSFTFIVNLIGYLDLVLCILAVVVLLIEDAKLRLVAAISVSIVALMVHEVFFVIFLPLLMLSFFLQLGRPSPTASPAARATPKHLSMLTAVLLLGTVATLTTVWISARPSLRADQVAAMQKEIASNTNFEIRPDFFEVMTRSVSDNAATTQLFYKQPSWWLANVISLLVFGPTLLLLVLATKYICRSDANFPKGSLLLATLAVFSPLAMHLVAWDAARWNAWVVVVSYLVLLTFCRFAKNVRLELSPLWKNAIFLVIVLNIASGNLLMDSRKERLFPFFKERLELKKLKPSWVGPPAL